MKKHIWVDGDACPSPIKEILYRAAPRAQVQITFVSNHFFRTPSFKLIRLIQVPKGFDVADNEIVKRCAAGDLVITGDIPLADQVITKGCGALNPRGYLFTSENIKERLNTRDLLDTLRSSGIQTGGPASLSSREIQAFANQLDRWLKFNPTE